MCLFLVGVANAEPVYIEAQSGNLIRSDDTFYQAEQTPSDQSDQNGQQQSPLHGHQSGYYRPQSADWDRHSSGSSDESGQRRVDSGNVSGYRLDAGDRLRITTFGEPDLSGEFAVDSSGYIAMPLIGSVFAKGLTIRALEAAIVQELMKGYLRQPQVSAEVLNYRPFYILGEVNDPGDYPYRAGLTVLEAVSIGGGFTYRANERRITIERNVGSSRSKAQTIRAAKDTIVLPGDVIRISERFF